jgi:hypothetical protein
MPFLIVIIGVILIITAFNNTHGELGTALESDVGAYFKWGAAIAAIVGIGFVPGFKTPSLCLLALVVLVLFLTRYKEILAGFTNFAGAGAGQTAAAASSDPATPTAAFSANPVQVALGGSAGGSGSSVASSGGSSTGGSSGSGVAGGLNQVASLAGGVSTLGTSIGQIGSLVGSGQLGQVGSSIAAAGNLGSGIVSELEAPFNALSAIGSSIGFGGFG